MKRTNFVTKLISVILFVFLVIYMGVYLFQSWRDPLTTAPAISLPAEEAFSAPGIILREETVVQASQSIVSSYVRDGEKVSAGQAYLVSYATEQERELDERRTQLEQEISQLEAYLSDGGALDQAAGMDTEIRSQIKGLNYAVGQGDLDELEERVISLRSLAFSGDAAGTSQRLESLRAELDSLGASSGSTSLIYAEQSGVYSSVVDGFEDLGPDDLEDLNPAALEALLAQERSGQSDSPGKLITGVNWYYAAIVPEEQAERLAEMLQDTSENGVSVVFSGVDSVTVSMRVHSVSDPDEDGNCVVAFSSASGLADTAALRQTEAKIVYDTFEGIRVPLEALHRDEESGLTYVYTLTGVTAELKYVTVVYEAADYYLVEPDTENTAASASLREGNTIIVRGRNLYDGKVVS